MGGTARQDSLQGQTQAQAMAQLALRHPIPTDSATLISLKRMAVGQYVYVLNAWRRAGYYPPYLSGLAALEDEYQRARAVAVALLQNVGIGGTPIDVDAMVAEPSGCLRDYTARPWENDAFFCGDMATTYWKAGLGLALKTYPVDQCSRAYEHAERDHELAARLAAGGAGSDGSDGDQ